MILNLDWAGTIFRFDSSGYYIFQGHCYIEDLSTMHWLTQYVASNPPLLTGPLLLVMQNWTFDEIWARFVPFCIPVYLRVNLPLAPHYVVLVKLPKMRCSGCMVISRTARTMCDLIDGDNVSAPDLHGLNHGGTSMMSQTPEC